MKEVAEELEERELDNEGGGWGQERMKATSPSCFSPSLPFYSFKWEGRNGEEVKSKMEEEEGGQEQKEGGGLPSWVWLRINKNTF